MRRLKYGIALVFALFLIFGFSLVALAANPHFISEGTDSINSSGALVATGFGTPRARRTRSTSEWSEVRERIYAEPGQDAAQMPPNLERTGRDPSR